MQFEMFSGESDFTFSTDQHLAWDALHSDRNVFLTGEAGSGKSFLIQQFIKKKNRTTHPVLASTGAAAVLIGGRTFHSYLGLGIMEGGFDATIERALKDKRVLRRLQRADALIIDEISMISAETLEVAEMICRMAREDNAPWGGLRIICIGDFAQLPPVSAYGQQKRWAFMSHAWERSDFQTVVLKQNMRSSNPEFLQVLNEVRRGEVSARVSDFLNQRSELVFEDFEGTRLFPRRNQTEQFNLNELKSLDGEITEIPTIYSGEERYIQALKKNSPLADVLMLKEEAFVMLRQNDHKQRWVNGTTGYISKIGKETLTVELLNRSEVEIKPSTFSLLNAEGKPMATATNFPISLAYAATIHKSQGMTLDRLQVNLNSLWEPGQAYVALSRITDPDQLVIDGWQPSSIKADPTVTAFYNSL